MQESPSTLSAWGAGARSPAFNRQRALKLMLAVGFWAVVVLALARPAANWSVAAPLALLPWIALALARAWPHHLSLLRGPGGRPVAIFYLAAAPGPLLCLRWLLRMETFGHWTLFLLASVILGLALAILVAGGGRLPLRRGSASVLALLVLFGSMVLYAGALLLWINQALDRATPRVHAAIIWSFQDEDNVLFPATHFVHFHFLDDVLSLSSLVLDAKTALALDQHRYLCVHAHQGALLVRWFDGRPCAPEELADAGVAQPSADQPAERDAAATAADLGVEDFRKLDYYFNALQSRYEAGSLSEEQLLSAVGTLSEGQSENDSRYQHWMDAFPESYAAHLLAGIHYYRVGRSARGTGGWSTVPKERQNQMYDNFARARQHLETSLQETNKPYLSALFLLDVAQYSSDKPARRKWLDLGVQLDPANRYVRTQYMETLTPWWGGSLDQMQSFLDESRRTGAPEGVLARLQVTTDRIHGEQLTQAGKDADALVVYEDGLAIDHSLGVEPDYEMLEGYVRALLALKRLDDAAPSLEIMTRQKPDVPWIHGQLASYDTKHRRPEEALAHFRQGAQLGDRWCEYMLGVATYQGWPDAALLPDRAAGRRWVEKAAAQKQPAANEFLKDHP